MLLNACFDQLEADLEWLLRAVYEIPRSASGHFECVAAGCSFGEENPHGFNKHLRICERFKGTDRSAALPWPVVEGSFRAGGGLLQPGVTRGESKGQQSTACASL